MNQNMPIHPCCLVLQQELVINPLHQELEPFNWVLAWQDVMPLGQVGGNMNVRPGYERHRDAGPRRLSGTLCSLAPRSPPTHPTVCFLSSNPTPRPADPILAVLFLLQLAALFETYFFPKWHAVLRHWLANSPNYDEVTRWCVHGVAACRGSLACMLGAGMPAQSTWMPWLHCDIIHAAPLFPPPLIGAAAVPASPMVAGTRAGSCCRRTPARCALTADTWPRQRRCHKQTLVPYTYMYFISCFPSAGTWAGSRCSLRTF